MTRSQKIILVDLPMGPNLLGHKKCAVLGQWNLDLERCADSHVWGPPLRESLEHC